MPDDSKKNYWFLVPTMILDKDKYRGKGRPRKSDYRKYPGSQDFMKMDWNKVEVNAGSVKGIVMSEGIN